MRYRKSKVLTVVRCSPSDHRWLLADEFLALQRSRRQAQRYRVPTPAHLPIQYQHRDVVVEANPTESGMCPHVHHVIGFRGRRLVFAAQIDVAQTNCKLVRVETKSTQYCTQCRNREPHNR